MFDKMLSSITDKWIESDIISVEDRDVYIYGLDLLLFSAINVIVILLAALIADVLPETIVLLMIIIPLQSFGGGYHAKTHLRCFSIMLFSWFVIMKCLLPFINEWLSLFLVIFAIVIIFSLSPVSHKNVQISNRQKNKMQKYARFFCVIASLVSQLIVWKILAYSRFGFVMSLRSCSHRRLSRV